MSFLSKLFGKKEQTSKEYRQSEIADCIISYLNDCKCEVIPPTRDAQPLWERYVAAYERGKTEGFVPVYIVCDGNVCEVVKFNSEDAGKTLKEYREELLSAELPDAVELLRERFEEYKTYIDEEWTLEELYGEFDKGAASHDFTYWKEYHFKKTHELIYAEIPVKSPWEVFAWIPFGGWNDCPMPEEIMSATKLWYEKYGAVPGLIGGDCMEFYLPKPISDKDEALKLAEQQYGFCQDIIAQCIGTIKSLADSITKSTVWSFWWD